VSLKIAKSLREEQERSLHARLLGVAAAAIDRSGVPEL